MIDSLKIDGDNIEALLKRVTTLTQMFGRSINPKESDATFEADSEIAKFHDALL